MNTERVLFFLNLLNEHTDGNAEEIARMYNGALDENDDVIRLKACREDNNFYRQLGNTLSKNGFDLLNKIYRYPSKAHEILPLIRQAYETIENAQKTCDDLMHSPFPFSDAVTVLRKKDVESYVRAFTRIASASAYLMLVYRGTDALKELSWSDAVGIQEMIYAVNTKFLPALSRTKRPNYYWIIKRCKMGGRALFGGDFYMLTYESRRNTEAFCNMLHKERIGTHAYLNIGAYESGEYDVPLCWGMGNITSFTPDNALQALQKDIAVDLRSPRREELARKMPAPRGIADILSDGIPYCITPDSLVYAMNQWQAGHEIYMRSNTQSCLFCGKPVGESRRVCKSHFTTEFDY